MSRRARLAVAAIALASAVGVALGGLRSLGPGATEAASPEASTQPRPATATAERRTLTVSEQLDGTLGYAGEQGVVNQLAGTLTRTPSPGETVRRGETLYELDGRLRPRLLYGARPAWRRLDGAVSNGADVRQLETNLAELGHLDAGEVDRDWDADTTAALRAWQTEAGVPADGVIDLGEIVFLPSDLRVTEVTGTLGGALAPGQPVLAGTTTRRVVTVELEADRTDLLALDDRVDIGLPDGRTTTGTVLDVGRIARAEPDGADQAGTPLVTVTIGLDDPAATAAWDEAPVEVSVVRETREDVLTVPVTALLALLEGGYVVEVVEDDGTTRYVPVSLGLFEDGRVEVRADDLEDGDAVVVPS